MDSLRGTREAPGRQERTNCTAWEAPGTKEAGKDKLDSLPGTREAGKDQLDSLGGTREAPGRQERTIWKGPFGQPARHQGGTREAGPTVCEAPGRQERTNWTAWEAPRRAPGSGLLRAGLWYGQPAVGPTPGFAAKRAVRH